MRGQISMPVALFAFRAIYVAFIVTASFTTLLHAHDPGLPAVAGIPALATLAGVEIVAAVLFLFRGTEIWACAALLTVYAVATVLSAALAIGACGLPITRRRRSSSRWWRAIFRSGSRPEAHHVPPSTRMTCPVT